MQTSMRLKNDLGELRAQLKKVDKLAWSIQNSKDEFDITDIEDQIRLAAQRKEICSDTKGMLMAHCKSFRKSMAR